VSSQMSAQNENSGTPFLENFRRDVRYAVRTLLRDAGFATFAMLIVGLGVGASCTIFSVVNTLLIRPLPFRDPGRLVWIANHQDETNDMSGKTSQSDYLLDMRARSQSYEDLAA
jgi:putative ABC transport system permease protein